MSKNQLVMESAVNLRQITPINKVTGFSLLDYAMDLDQREEPWIVTARQYWRPVHRKRFSKFKTALMQRDGQDIWIVGDEEMLESEIKVKVKDLMIRNVRPVWGIITEEQKTSLINLEIN